MKKRVAKKKSPSPVAKEKKKPALRDTDSETVRGVKALYGDKKKRRVEQPRSTKYKIAGENGTQLRYRKVKYN